MALEGGRTDIVPDSCVTAEAVARRGASRSRPVGGDVESRNATRDAGTGRAPAQDVAFCSSAISDRLQRVDASSQPAARPFVRPAPVPPAEPLSWWRTMRVTRRNVLEAWPQAAYEQMVVRRRLLGVEHIILSDPRTVRHMLNGNAAGYGRPVLVRRQLRSGLGEGVLLSEGESWRRKRRILAPSFTPQRVGQLSRPPPKPSHAAARAAAPT